MSFDNQDSSETVSWNELVTSSKIEHVMSSEIQQLSENMQLSHNVQSLDGLHDLMSLDSPRSSRGLGSLLGYIYTLSNLLNSEFHNDVDIIVCIRGSL